MALERSKVFYKFELFKYLFGAIFAWSDVGSDIATCILYYRRSQFEEFGFCLAFALAPSIFMTVAHLVQHLRSDGIVNIIGNLVYYAFFGSGMMKMKLFILCVKNFKEVWSRPGYLVMKEDEKNDIRTVAVYDYIQTLLEDIPQMVLQIYTLTQQDTSNIHWIQFVSIALSFVNLILTLALFENNTLPGVQNVKAYILVILFYNTFLLAARIVTIVSFLIGFSWITAIILVVHELVCIVFYYIKNRKRFTDKDVWWVAIILLPCYIFTYLGFKVKEIRLRSFELKISRSLLSSSLYYATFTIENIMMMSLYYSKASVRTWYSSGATAAVIMMTLVGVFLNLIFTNLYFRDYHRTRHMISHQGVRRASRFERNSRVRFSRSVRVHPHPLDRDQTVTEVIR
ncbi:uncharacterized protein LOC116300177 [Actinia tenebrosa]|uniref:XK-related protein n=1 Tax=Actinia tenebrosa TaxID=6105 RepID=A0A6P8IBT7_ACTTE|nr:uncharacterized protein LOC116300177 [Actinia tenebrosa]